MAARVPAEELEDRTAPRTRTEQALQAIWAGVLGVEQPGVHANFFALGGHSLRVAQIVSRVAEDMGVGLALRDVFTWPTIAELAGFIDRSIDQAERPAIPRAEPAPHYPTSHAQQRLWVLDQIGTGEAYHMTAALRLHGSLLPEALARTVAELHRRHETLRTSLVEIDGELRQIVAEHVEPRFRIVDLSQAADPNAAARAEARHHAKMPFDLSQAPLLRTDLLRLGEDEHVLLFAMHHVVSDGWSLDVLTQELAELYASYASGRAPALAPLPVQHRDFVLWQRRRQERDGARHRGFWLRQLGEAMAPLDLPTDFPRPAVKTYRGAVERVVLPPLLLRRLDQLARREQASLFMLVLALTKTLLFRISGAGDISVGSPVAGREHPDLRRQIGLFVNTLVLRSRIEGEEAFVDLLRRVRDNAADWYAHQEYPFDLLVQDLNPPRDSSRNPLFEVMVVLQNTDNTPVELPGIAVEALGESDGATQFDLLWSFETDADGLHLSLRYNVDLFRADTAARLVRLWRNLAEAAVADPATAVGRLPLLTAEERAALLRTPSPPPELAPVHRSIVEAFEAQAAARPSSVALADGALSLTYGELNAQANALARRVRNHMEATNALDEPLVAICIERSIGQIVATLGVLKAGAAYLPLDPDAPASRLRFMVEDAGAILLLTSDEAPKLDAPSLPPQWRLDPDTDAIEPSENLSIPIDPDQAAYVIYTSGSTGEPKGTVVTHRNVLRLFSATRPLVRLRACHVGHCSTRARSTSRSGRSGRSSMAVGW